MDAPENKNEHKTRSGTFWSWKNFRDVSLGLLMLVIATRIAFSSTTIDLSGFNFTDLLSLILAISAIGLSAAFYFKADESSRGFYNNSYQFTKEVSEILGRIEAGFGQQLAHINEGYAGLNRKIDNMPYNPDALREQMEAKKAEIAEQEAKFADVIEDLMRRAKMDDAERKELGAKLDRLQKEADQSKAQLSSISNVDADTPDESVHAGMNSLGAYMAGRFKSLRHAPDHVIQDRVEKLIDLKVIPDVYLNLLRSFNMIDGNRFTERGLSYVRSVR